MSRHHIQQLGNLLVKIEAQTNNSGTQVPFYPTSSIVHKAQIFCGKKRIKITFPYRILFEKREARVSPRVRHL